MHKTKQRTVPLWAILAARRKNLYGSVPDLPDDELADPEELERQVFLQEYGPVLSLPRRGEWSEFGPTIDEQGNVDWGAFGTMDFERMSQRFNRKQYRLERLRDELERVLILLGTVKRRLPGRAKYLVLKHLQEGVIELEDVANWDMFQMAKLHERAKSLQEQIARLDEEGRPMPQEQVAWLMS